MITPDLEQEDAAVAVPLGARTFAYNLFRALPDSLLGLRMLHRMARIPRILWPQRVRITRHRIAGRTPRRTISVWVMRPKTEVANLPIVAHFHGGAFAIGAPEQDFKLLSALMANAPCVFVTPSYRLSIDHPYPAGLEDGVETLVWAVKNASELGGDPSRLFVMGQSAGGGLAAALCQWARDTQKVKISGQLLIGAMLDDRTDGTLEKRKVSWSWSPARNRLAWSLYLRSLGGDAAAVAYAAPARRCDLSGLPPALGIVGAADLFRTENQDYFERLAQNGGTSRLTVIPNAYHGIEVLAPRSIPGRNFLDLLRSCFANLLASPDPIQSPCLRNLDAPDVRRNDR